MGVTKAAITELEHATSALWGAMRDIREYRAAPEWKQREQAPDLARAQAQATEARRTIDELKRRYGIEKKGLRDFGLRSGWRLIGRRQSESRRRKGELCRT
jgi:hypothetical protein